MGKLILKIDSLLKYMVKNNTNVQALIVRAEKIYFECIHLLYVKARLIVNM